MRYLCLGSVLALGLGLLACGGTQGEGGGAAPTIGDLEAAPDSAAAGSTIEVSGLLTLTDPDGDIYGGAVFYTYEGETYGVPLEDPSLQGLTAVRVSFWIPVQLSDMPGSREIDIWMLDRAGHRSNTLAFTLRQLWTRQFGTASDDVGEAVVVVADGGVAVVGTTEGDLHGTSNQGGSDVFLARYAADAVHLGTVLFGGSDNDVAHACATDSVGSLYVVGETLSLNFDGELGEGAPGDGNSDGFLSKRDSTGARLWTRLIQSGSPDRAFGVAVDRTGVYVVGETFGSLGGQDHAGGGDAFLCKFTTSGALLWTRQWGSHYTDMAYAVGLDGVGGVYVVGSISRAVLSATIGLDAFLLKFDVDGAQEWPEPTWLATGGADFGRGLAVGADGVSYVVGRVLQEAFPGETAAGRYDAFVGAVAADGGLKWVRQFGGDGNEGANAATLDATGRLCVTGYEGGDHLGDRDSRSIFVTEYDPNGTQLWYGQTQTREAPNNGRGLAFDSAGNLFVTGSVGASLQYLDAIGGADVFVLKYDMDGELR